MNYTRTQRTLTEREAYYTIKFGDCQDLFLDFQIFFIVSTILQILPLTKAEKSYMFSWKTKEEVEVNHDKIQRFSGKTEN